MKKNLLLTVATFTFSTMIALNASAATQAITAAVNFITPLSIAVTTSPNFGNVAQITSTSASYTLSTAGVVTASGPGAAIYSGGTPAAAGNLTITGATTQSITVSTGGYTTSNNILASAATCKYNGGAIVTNCDAGFTASTPSTSTSTLLIGLTITPTGTPNFALTTTPGLTVTVNYN